MVYDGTKSGLNDAIWVPSFWLPTVRTLLRMVTFETWMSDLDVGEMFLNFILHSSLRPYCGVDLTQFFPEEAQMNLGRLIEVWTMPGMGFKWSPYQCTQGMMVLDKVIGETGWTPTTSFGGTESASTCWAPQPTTLHFRGCPRSETRMGRWRLTE